MLDANEDPFFLKEKVEFCGNDGLSSLWGSAFKYPSLAFVSTYRKKVLTRNEGGNTKKFQEPVQLLLYDTKKFEEADTTASSKQYMNGLRFTPSCDSKCFIGDKRCAHTDFFRVELNNVGDYVAFPTVWWHHGICNFYLRNKMFFTAQLFATPHSDLGSIKHSLRKSSNMKHTQGKLDASLVNTLMTDLYMNRDKEYSATNFPPAKKFFGKIDRDKNRHILSDQIHKVPKIQRLVLAIE